MEHARIAGSCNGNGGGVVMRRPFGRVEMVGRWVVVKSVDADACICLPGTLIEPAAGSGVSRLRSRGGAPCTSQSAAACEQCHRSCEYCGCRDVGMRRVLASCPWPISCVRAACKRSGRVTGTKATACFAHPHSRNPEVCHAASACVLSVVAKGRG
jgi:hypothetical protein